MKVGDRVTWHRVSRGGYGYVTYVAAVVVAVGIFRATIRVAYRGRRTDPWSYELKRVAFKSLTARETYVPTVDDYVPPV